MEHYGKKRENDHAWDCRGSLGITFFQPNSSGERLQMCFSSFGVALKVPQGAHFAFSSPGCQKNNVTQASPQMHHPASGVENGVSTGELLAPAGKAKVTSNAKQHRPKEEKAPPESKPFAFKVVPFSRIKEHLCLVPSLHLACPMWVSHQTYVAIPSFHTEKTQVMNVANSCLRWIFHGGWPSCKKPPLPQTPQGTCLTLLQALLLLH